MEFVWKRKFNKRKNADDISTICNVVPSFFNSEALLITIFAKNKLQL